MARINIENRWWTDPRRDYLSKLLGDGDRTETVSVRAWRLSQEYWNEGKLVPGNVFCRTLGAIELLQSGLARIQKGPKTWLYPDRSEEFPNGPERDPNDSERESNEHRTIMLSVRELNDIIGKFVYVNGSREHHFWTIRRYLQRVEAGKKSAAKRKLRFGTAQPSNEHRTKQVSVRDVSRTSPNEPERASNDAEHSSSFSSSSSNSINKRRNLKNKNIYGLDFEAIYQIYPKRIGNQGKAKGLERCESKITSPELYEGLKKAVTNYKTHCHAYERENTPFVAQFSTFMSDWEAWINPDPIQLVKPIGLPNGKVSVGQSDQSQRNEALVAQFLDRGKIS